MTTPVFRFAPSPNGRLHLGHAASALLNARLARETGGRFLLRIEDIDTTRCHPKFTQAIHEDMAWLGLDWAQTVAPQSTRVASYGAALGRLQSQGLLYPCFCSRKDIARDAHGQAGTDPDGAPLYPGTCRSLEPENAASRIAAGEPHALRLRMEAALVVAGKNLTWLEGWPDGQPIAACPARWGDVVVKRKEFAASYHIAVVVDDAAQGVTHVVRGMDLFHATSVHRLLQQLLGLPQPRYIHHLLIRDTLGDKLAKSAGSRTLADLRAAGVSTADVIAMAALQLDQPDPKGGGDNAKSG
jgi:glutamyl-Q tRNA(Asp) synthetase